VSESRNGKIVTFYSYKGGTGRSMTLANVGWLLASAGRRVLLIDWDFEAPGLHRYLHPFLSDKELVSAAGLVDFFGDFATAARVAKTDASRKENWFEPYASLVRYTLPVQWDAFPGDGALELVPAGRQDASYPIRAMTFDWNGFYATGGGVFLEAVKARLRHDYDYVLIDSRTGISDTSGICTVQMPDELIVLFTFNQQSMKGAAAIADSADQLRRKSNGEPGLRIWPVPSRVESAEKDRLEAARDECRLLFERHIGHLSRSNRSDYWALIEIPYHAYYAYEEVLVSFAERTPFGPMPTVMRELASRITGTTLEPYRMPEQLRAETLARFERPRGARPAVYANFRRKDAAAVRPILSLLEQQGLSISSEGENAAARAQAIVIFVGPDGPGEFQKEEIARLNSMQKPLLQVLINGATTGATPNLTAIAIRGDGRKPNSEDVAKVASLLTTFASVRTSWQVDPNDPQKGQFGGSSVSNERKLTATVTPISDEYFQLALMVFATGATPLTGEVEFHLHPTFGRPIQTVQVVEGTATLKLLCWGAFTVGAVADNGQTRLELDLAQDSSFPANFRSR
jgi:hypothetical protein